jgi:hypothetical protein
MTTVLCNAGPLIALGKLNRLELLAELTGWFASRARYMTKPSPEDWRSARLMRTPSAFSGEQRAGLSSK